MIYELFLGVFALFTTVQATFAQSAPTTFGDRQLAQMLDDRPEMKGIFQPDDYIVAWVIGRFERGAFGDRVYWDHNDTRQVAEHLYRTPTLVRVTTDRRYSGISKWSFLIFELFHLETANQQRELDQQSEAHGIDRSTYVTARLHLEHRALVKTQNLLRKHLGGPVHCSQDDGFPFWLLNADLEFNAYVAYLDTKRADEYDPRDHYSRLFDAMYQRSHAPITLNTRSEFMIKPKKRASTVAMP